MKVKDLHKQLEQMIANGMGTTKSSTSWATVQKRPSVALRSSSLDRSIKHYQATLGRRSTACVRSGNGNYHDCACSRTPRSETFFASPVDLPLTGDVGASITRL